MNQRLDVTIQHPAFDGTDEVIRRVIQKVSLNQVPGFEAVGGVVSARLVRNTEPIPDCAGCLQLHHKVLKGGGGPQPALSTDAKYTFTMSVMAHRLKQLVRLIRDARTQLPPDRPGAIFIDIGGSKVFEDKLHELLRQPEYSNTPWISLWEKGQILKAVIRQGQPFDARLAEPRPTEMV